MKKINVAIIGGGGREHAIALKLKESPLLDKLFCLPGNAGIAECATCAPVSPMDFEGIYDFCIKNGVDLVFVAPDDPLAGGLVDFLTERGVKAFGPVKQGTAYRLRHTGLSTTLKARRNTQRTAICPLWSKRTDLRWARELSSVEPVKRFLTL